MQQGWRGQALCFKYVEFTFTKGAALRDICLVDIHVMNRWIEEKSTFGSLKNVTSPFQLRIALAEHDINS